MFGPIGVRCYIFELMANGLQMIGFHDAVKPVHFMGIEGGQLCQPAGGKIVRTHAMKLPFRSAKGGSFVDFMEIFKCIYQAAGIRVYLFDWQKTSDSEKQSF